MGCRTSRPGASLFVLRHSSTEQLAQKTGGAQDPAFEPVLIDSALTDSELLSTSGGNGLLIWHATGQH